MNYLFLLVSATFLSLSEGGRVHVTKQEASEIREHCQNSWKSAPVNETTGYESADKIANGQRLAWGVQASFVVFVKNEMGGCTGSLLSSRHVLTAAHCVMKDSCETGTFEIVPTSVFAFSCWDNPGHKCYTGPSVTKFIKYKVIDIYVPKKYEETTCSNVYGNDIAILTLDNPVSHSMPDIVCLPTVPVQLPLSVRIFGLGKLSEDNSNKDLDVYTTSLTVTRDAGNGAYAGDPYGTPPCPGDSGGSYITGYSGVKTAHFIHTNGRGPCSSDGGQFVGLAVFPWNQKICDVTGICVGGGSRRLMEQTHRLAANQPTDFLYPPMPPAKVVRKWGGNDLLRVHYDIICKEKDSFTYNVALWESDKGSDDLIAAGDFTATHGRMLGTIEGNPGGDGIFDYTYEFYIRFKSDCNGHSEKEITLKPECAVDGPDCFFAVRGTY